MITKLRLSEVTEEPKHTFSVASGPQETLRPLARQRPWRALHGDSVPARPQTGRTARGATCTREVGICGRVSQGAGKTEGKRGRLRSETLNTGEKANAVSRGAAVWPESPLCPDEEGEVSSPIIKC